jgi:hypothetical protein
MRRFVALLAFAAVLGCGGDASTRPSDTAISGTYTLQTVNGLKLPFTILQTDSVKFELTSDSFTLKDDKSWTEVGTSRTTISGQVSTDAIADSGTYVLNKTTITLISVNGSTDGTIGGGKLTLSNDAVVAVYVK